MPATEWNEENSAETLNKKIVSKPEEPTKELKCDECDFVAKNETGLKIHKAKH